MLAALALASSLAGTASAQANTNIASRMSEVNGLKLHYLTAGHGPTVILLHGYTQTSRMWKPIIPLLAAKFTVIAPDLPWIGDSGIPTNGLDMKNAAITIHSLSKYLGVPKARVVGHDIGLMGCVRIRGAVSFGDRKAGGDGRFSSGCCRMGRCL